MEKNNSNKLVNIKQWIIRMFNCLTVVSISGALSSFLTKEVFSHNEHTERRNLS